MPIRAQATAQTSLTLKRNGTPSVSTPMAAVTQSTISCQKSATTAPVNAAGAAALALLRNRSTSRLS